MNENEITNLLFSIPKELEDEESCPDDLSLTDLSPERVYKVQQLLNHEDKCTRIQAARMLTNWGDDVGFNFLADLICHHPPEDYLGVIDHRLYGFDETGKFLIDAIIGYWSHKETIGIHVRENIFVPIKKLVSLSIYMDFSADIVFRLIKWGMSEYIPMMKEYLAGIIEDPHCDRWKIADAISGLLPLDKEFVQKTLALHGKKIKNYPKGFDYYGL